MSQHSDPERKSDEPISPRVIARAIRFALLIFAVASTALSAPGQETESKTFVCNRAHAHNDYLHTRPLLDAIDNGFCSVEADVFLVEGELLVAHAFWELRPNRTLKSLYLDPLQQLVQKNEGSVHGDGAPFTLLIDIKNKGAETYKVLDALLSNYPDVFTATHKGAVKKGPVVAVVSGDRPIQMIQSDNSRFVGIDGRLSDLSSTLPVELMPLISDKWTKHFRWRGDGMFPAAEQQKLTDIVHQVHAAGRRIRFWATPDNEALWKVLDESGADLINTDDLTGLSEYLRQSQTD